jgi:hypothetical protein
MAINVYKPRVLLKSIVFIALIVFGVNHGVIRAGNQSENNKIQMASRNKALTALCKIGLKDMWSDERINEAIATIGFGHSKDQWGDSAEGIAYKLCNYGGYLK